MIEIIDLHKSFGDNTLFDSLSFKVNDGEILGICGESGCGKSTLVRIICGLDRNYRGHIMIDGEYSDKKESNLRNIGLVMQNSNLWSTMNVYENIIYGVEKERLKGIELEVNKIAYELKISDILNRKTTQISGGQAKRVSLARALISGRKNLLLDEPLSNIDKDTKEIVLKALKSEWLENKCVIYVTHDETELDILGAERLRM